MHDTRVLLERVAQFRRRLEEIPRLIPAPEPDAPPSPPAETLLIQAPPRLKSQAILEHSLRQLAGTPGGEPPALSERARQLLIDAQGLVKRLRAVADDPLLAWRSVSGENAVDHVVLRFRESTALTEAAIRYVLTFPEPVAEQERLCTGLEGMITAAQRQLDLLAEALERRRREAARLDRLTHLLCTVSSGRASLDATPLFELAASIRAEELGQPLRLAYVGPDDTRAYLGSAEYPAPARFIAAHSLNCAYILARVIEHDPDWQKVAGDVILAGLLHDVGMLGVDAALLARSSAWPADERDAVAAHTRLGAEMIHRCLPNLSFVAEVAANHHERADGVGYPARLRNDQVSALARLVAAVDVYAALCSPRPHRSASDPRSALTDVLLMAERGQLDRRSATLVAKLGHYPPGTVVELADGSTAIVTASTLPGQAEHLAARPHVAVIADPQGRAFPHPRFVDLAGGKSGNVVRAVAPDERRERLSRSYPEWV